VRKGIDPRPLIASGVNGLLHLLAFLAAFTLLGVMVSLGSTGIMAQAMSGLVIICSRSLAAGGVRNFSRLTRGQGAQASTTVTIGYDAPWRQVQALLMGAASGTPGLHAEVPPCVLQRSLSDFHVSYELVVRLEDPVDRPQVLSVLHGRIQDAFNQAGVQIMPPHFVLQPASPVLGERPGAALDGTPRTGPVSS